MSCHATARGYLPRPQSNQAIGAIGFGQSVGLGPEGLQSVHFASSRMVAAPGRACYKLLMP